jgi:hypothetical protein
MRGHSLLAISARQSETGEDFYWTFEGVEYVDCPIVWNGSDLEIAPANECLELIRRVMPQFAPFPDDVLIRSFKLFVSLTSENRKIQIIALNGGKIDDLPALYRL